MAHASAGTVLHYIAKLFEAGRGLGDARHRNLTDTQLLADFVRERDESAFASLAERHWRLVWRVCRQILEETTKTRRMPFRPHSSCWPGMPARSGKARPWPVGYTASLTVPPSRPPKIGPR